MSEPAEERRHYSLKPKNFERINAPKGQDDLDPNDVREMLKQNLDRYESKTHGQNSAAPSKRNEGADPNDVYKLLQENLNQHIAHEKPMDIAKPVSHRRRDYIGALVLGNSVLMGLALFLPLNAVTLLFILGAVTVYSVGLSWVFWGVMSDY